MPNRYLRSLLDRMDDDRKVIDDFRSRYKAPFEDDPEAEDSPLNKLREVGLNLWREFKTRASQHPAAEPLGEAAGWLGSGFARAARETPRIISPIVPTESFPSWLRPAQTEVPEGLRRKPEFVSESEWKRALELQKQSPESQSVQRTQIGMELLNPTPLDVFTMGAAVAPRAIKLGVKGFQAAKEAAPVVGRTLAEAAAGEAGAIGKGAGKGKPIVPETPAAKEPWVNPQGGEVPSDIEDVVNGLKAKGFDGTVDRLERGLITLEQARGELEGTLKPIVQMFPSLRTANAADVIADIKARGFDRQSGYGQFVKARDLKPEINAAQFGDIYESVTPKKFEYVKPVVPEAKPATEIPVKAEAPEPLPKVPETAIEAGKPPPVEPPKTAVAASPEPQPPAKEGYAVNIKLEKFDESIRGDIQKWADTNPEVIDQARRGVVPLSETEAHARKLIEDTGGNPAKLIKRVGKAYNDAELRAISGALANARQELRAMRDVIAQGQNTTENVLKLAQLTEKANFLQLAAHASRAEAGRALSSLRMINEALESKNNVVMEKVLKQLGSKADYEKIAKAMKGLNWDDPVAVNNFIRQVVKPNMHDYIYEIFVNSILSGPKTHIVNTTTNVASAVVSPVERATAALIDIPLAKLQGRQVERFLDEVPAEIVGAVTAVPDGFRAWLKTQKMGISPTAVSKYEYRPSAFGGKLGRAINIPVTGLEAADAFIYTTNYKAAFNAEVVRMGRKQGLKGKDLKDFIKQTELDPPANLIQRASEIANERAFRGDPGEFTQSLYNLRRAVKIGNVEPLKYVIPFIRTPVNLLKFGLERSPLGFANPKLWSNLRAKNPAAADQLAKAVLGSLVAGGIAWYFGNGRITGAAPRNPNERDRFYREGKIPYAVKIGDNWISYQRLEPFNQVFAQVASVVQAVDNKDSDALGKAMSVAQSIGTNFVSQTYMSGIADLIEAVSDPERYGAEWAERFVQAMAVPYSAFTRTMAQAIDPIIRQPRGLGEQLKTGIPIWSRQVPEKFNVLGDTSIRKTPWFSPIAISQEDASRINQELSRHEVNIGFAGKSIANVPLTPAEEGLYKRTAGELAKRHILQALDTPEYALAKGDEAHDILERAANAGKKEARQWMVENGGIDQPKPDDPTEVRQAREELSTNVTGKRSTPGFSLPSSFRSPPSTYRRRRPTRNPFRSTRKRVIRSPFR